MPRIITDTGNPYTTIFKQYAGWNISPTVLDDPRLFKVLPHFADWTRADHADLIECLESSERTLRDAWRDAIVVAERTFGADGPVISGGLRESWPADVKDHVRDLAHAVTDTVRKIKAHQAAMRFRRRQ